MVKFRGICFTNCPKLKGREMTKEDFCLLRESLEQAVAFKQGNKTAARSVIRSTEEDAGNRQKLVLKNGSVIEYVLDGADSIRGESWFVQN